MPSLEHCININNWVLFIKNSAIKYFYINSLEWCTKYILKTSFLLGQDENAYTLFSVARNKRVPVSIKYLHKTKKRPNERKV